MAEANKLIGFESIKSSLHGLYQNNKLHHAILLHGKKSIGKASFAKDFALEIINQSNPHPDLIIIKKDENKRDISVDQIREIADFVNRTSAISKNKFIIIDSADHLNRASANALLKILEEPHPNNYLILTANSLSKLLPTIKSRCYLIKAPDIDFASFKAIVNQQHPSFLPKISETELKILAEICDNAPAQAIVSGEELIGFYRDFLSSIKAKKIDEKILKKISDKNLNDEIFSEIIRFFLKRLSSYNNGTIEFFIFDEKEVFVDLHKKFSQEKFFDLNSKINSSLNFNLSLNLDKKLTFINIFNNICF